MIEIVDVESAATGEDAFSDRLLALLDAHASGNGHPWDGAPVRLEVRVDEAFAGSLAARVIYDWLDVRLLAVDQAYGGGGVGRALMVRAEEIARQSGTLGMNVDTMGFQAPGLYTRLGYREIARLPGTDPAEDRIFFAKPLGGPA